MVEDKTIKENEEGMEENIPRALAEESEGEGTDEETTGPSRFSAGEIIDSRKLYFKLLSEDRKAFMYEIELFCENSEMFKTTDEFFTALSGYADGQKGVEMRRYDGKIIGFTYTRDKRVKDGIKADRIKIKEAWNLLITKLINISEYSDDDSQDNDNYHSGSEQNMPMVDKQSEEDRAKKEEFHARFKGATSYEEVIYYAKKACDYGGNKKSPCHCGEKQQDREALYPPQVQASGITG